MALANTDLRVKLMVKERDQWDETEQCRAGLRNQVNEGSPSQFRARERITML